jgi:ATP-binding cassette subfamily F protein uup
VSHDRAFLDNVVTSTLVFEGGGRVAEYAGGYADWVRQRLAAAAPVPSAAPKRPIATSGTKSAAKPKKLSYRETAELAELPDRIDALERERERRYASLSDPALVRDGAAMAEARARLAALDTEIAALIERWEALETLAATPGA